MIVIDRFERRRTSCRRSISMFTLSAGKIRSIEDRWAATDGAPVFTVNGRYTARGWTEWTQGFQFGSALLQFDATGDRKFLELGRKRTLERMSPHVSATGVHDHGFNNVSTYGALWRLAREGRFKPPAGEIEAYQLALKVSGAVQAGRWTRLPFGGFIHSFNGAHSLFVDTIRTLRVARDLLAARTSAPWRAGRRDQPDRSSDLARGIDGRVLRLLRAWPRHLRRAGPGRARVVVQSRQRQLPWPELAAGLLAVQYLDARACVGADRVSPSFSSSSTSVPNDALERHAGRVSVEGFMMEAARATADFYIEHAAAADGVPYWDTGAPGLLQLGDWATRDADPFNPHEPVDSSAAAIAAQGLIRLGRRLDQRGQDGSRYTQAGLRTLGHASRSGRSVSQPRAGASRPAPACGVSPAQRLGRASRRRARRHEANPRSGATTTCAKPRCSSGGLRTSAVSHVLRSGEQAVTRPVALVTGGTRGIGLGIARALAGARL